MKNLAALAFFCRLRLCAVKCAGRLHLSERIQAHEKQRHYTILYSETRETWRLWRDQSRRVFGSVLFVTRSAAHFSAMIARSAVTEVHP
jgi:hypothetical protein